MPRLLNSPSIRAAAAALAMLLALTVSAGLRADDDTPRLVSVSGEAEQRVAPDMATLTAEIISDGLDPDTARREADGIAAAALDILAAAGIAPEDMDSTALNLSPRYRWDEQRREQQLVGYRVSRGITARVLDLQSLGELLVALSDAGVNRLSPPRLGLADEESVYRTTLAAAAGNARQRADTVASALGERIARVHSVAARGEAQPRPMMAERAMLAASADSNASAAESYQSGHITYRVIVDASFVLE
jgi:uncharacterized protein YggE